MIKYLGHQLIKSSNDQFLKYHYDCIKCNAYIYYNGIYYYMIKRNSMEIYRLELSCDEFMIKSLLE